MRPVTTVIADRLVRPTAVSLFDQIGGRAQVAWLVARFQRRLFADEDLARQLAPIGAAALGEGLTVFLTKALGEPVGEAATAAHPPADRLSVWLDAEPFTRVVAYLWITLLDLDVSTELRDEVVVAIVLRALAPASE
jgi:truncated hemoglobin YjbI